MSSEEEDDRPRKLRIQNACDVCRRKKVKCDSGVMKDNTCTNCIMSRRKCTHTIPDARKQGPANEASWHRVEQLKRRAKALEEALLARAPDFDFEGLAQVGNSSSFTQSQASMKANITYTHAGVVLGLLPNSAPHAPIQYEQTSATAESEGTQMQNTIKEGRFFGPSSTFKYYMDAIKVKKGFIDTEHPSLDGSPCGFKRKEFWEFPSYEIETAIKQTVRSYQFPEEDLLRDLVDIHFRISHSTIPIIYEPRFRKNIQQGLHHYDPDFGALVLMMCALSSRDSSDPRVYLPGQNQYSAGWKYYEQIPTMRQSVTNPPSLHELQMYCLALQYSLGTSSPQNIWILVSLGLRLCHELGIHRKRPPGYTPTIEEEERKRVFWHLVSLDRSVSSFVGRPSEYRDEDFDADLPAECDDEYIVESADGSILFMQPADKPSKMMYLTCLGRLQDILSVALRALYSTTKSRIQMGLTGEKWRQGVVSELDSALNKWLDTIPQHLRWSEAQQQTNWTSFIQSLSLHISYNVVQIQIHRPLISSSNVQESSASSAICVSAARSIAGMASSPMAQEGAATDPAILSGCFMAATTLLMHMWRNKEQGKSNRLQRDTKDVEKCKTYLRLAEKRWLCAGRFLDLLNELAFVQDIIVPQAEHRDIGANSSDSSPPSSFAVGTHAADPSANLWSTGFLPQYGVHQDYPSIPVQIPFSVDYGTDLEYTLPEAEDQLFWQAPIGFDLSEWDQYIARVSNESNRN